MKKLLCNLLGLNENSTFAQIKTEYIKKYSNVNPEKCAKQKLYKFLKIKEIYEKLSFDEDNKLQKKLCLNNHKMKKPTLYDREYISYSVKKNNDRFQLKMNDKFQSVIDFDTNEEKEMKNMNKEDINILTKDYYTSFNRIVKKLIRRDNYKRLIKEWRNFRSKKEEQQQPPTKNCLQKIDLNYESLILKRRKEIIKTNRKKYSWLIRREDIQYDYVTVIPKNERVNIVKK